MALMAISKMNDFLRWQAVVYDVLYKSCSISERVQNGDILTTDD